MMTRSPRLCIHWSPHRRLTALRPQALRSAHSYHTATSAHLFLRAPLATSQAKQCQLRSPRPSRSSHSLEFLQRCNLLIAPLQPPQLPVPISPLDAAVQTISPCDVSQDASTQTSDQPVYSLSFDVAVQTSFHSAHTSSLDAVVQTIPHSTLSQNVSKQMGFSLSFLVFC